MKSFTKRMIAAVILSIPGSTVVAQELHTLYYENGKKAVEGKWLYIGGGMTGTSALISNIKNLETLYEWDKRSATANEFRQSAPLIWAQGPLKMWYADGQLMRRDNYKNGVLNGNHQKFYPSGKHYSRGGFVNGMPDGPWIYYYTDGRVMMETNCRAYTQKELDTIVRSRDFAVNKKITADQFSSDYDRRQFELRVFEAFSRQLDRLPLLTLYTGRQMFYKPNGEKETELNYKDGRRHGKWIMYDKDQVAATVIYEMDSLVSVLDRNGKDVLSEDYKADEADFSYYYFSGIKAASKRKLSQPDLSMPLRVVSEMPEFPRWTERAA